MTWTKVGSEFLTDPKLLAVSRSDRLLFLELHIWSNEHATNGAVPEHIPVRISDVARASAACKRLHENALLEKTPTGWLIVDFLKHQPAAEDVERTQKLARERARRQRQHRNGDHSLCLDSRFCRHTVTRDATRDSRVSHDARTDPYRTDPSRKDGEGEVWEGVGAAGRRPPNGAAPTAPPPPTSVVKPAPDGKGVIVTIPNFDKLVD